MHTKSWWLYSSSYDHLGKLTDFKQFTCFGQEMPLVYKLQHSHHHTYNKNFLSPPMQLALLTYYWPLLPAVTMNRESSFIGRRSSVGLLPPIKSSIILYLLVYVSSSPAKVGFYLVLIYTTWGCHLYCTLFSMSSSLWV